MAMTELTHSQLVFQGAVGKDHHLWRSRAQVKSPELRGEERTLAEDQWKGSGSSEGRVVWVLLLLQASCKDLLGIRLSERERQQGANKGLVHVGKGTGHRLQNSRLICLLTVYNPAMPCETQEGQNCLQSLSSLIPYLSVGGSQEAAHSTTIFETALHLLQEHLSLPTRMSFYNCVRFLLL